MMDLYLLDENLRRSAIIDVYESLIWTERFNDIGDFEFVAVDNPNIRRALTEDTWFVIPQSKRVMIVENTEIMRDSEGRRLFKATGRSLESLLENRVGMPSKTAKPDGKWVIDDYVDNAIKTLFNTICVNKVLSPNDGIPGYVAGNYLNLGTIPRFADKVKFELEADTLLGLIQKIAQVYNLGFRLVRNETNRLAPTIHFEVYYGTDLSSSNVSTANVIFDEELENLTDVSQLTVGADYKNVAYVYGKNGFMEVLGEGIPADLAPALRRVLLVKADDIELSAGTELNNALTQRGREELALYRKVLALDGKLTETSNYVYGQHYQLGDIIEMRGEGGIANDMRVTEQIMTSDAEGIRSYPTLSLDQLISPGSWAAWGGQRVWNEIASTVVWADT